MAFGVPAFVPSHAGPRGSILSAAPNLAMAAQEQASHTFNWVANILELAALIAMCITLRWKKRKHVWRLRMKSQLRRARAEQKPLLARGLSMVHGCSIPAQLSWQSSDGSFQPAALLRKMTDNFDPVGEEAVRPAFPAALPSSWRCIGAVEDHLGMPSHDLLKIAADVVKDIDTDMFVEKVGFQQCVSDVLADVIVDMYVPG